MQTLKNKGIDMWNSVVDIINSSITPHEVSLAVSIGILGGLWPIPMTSFIGCIILQTILGACFKIDARQMMLIQIVNMIMTPLHLMYYSTFIRFGEGIFKVKAADRFDASSLVENLNKDFFGTLSSSASGLMFSSSLANSNSSQSLIILSIFACKLAALEARTLSSFVCN